MIQSMTGFGKATLQLPTKKITVEVKSLNSKGLDLNVRMPSLYREMELGLRNQIALKLERGKVDFSIFICWEELRPAMGDARHTRKNTGV